MSKHVKAWNHCVEQWISRAEAQGLKPKTVKYQDRRLEFLLGASTALVAAGVVEHPSPMLMLAAVGRPSKELLISEVAS